MAWWAWVLSVIGAIVLIAIVATVIDAIQSNQRLAKVPGLLTLLNGLGEEKFHVVYYRLEGDPLRLTKKIIEFTDRTAAMNKIKRVIKDRASKDWNCIGTEEYGIELLETGLPQ